MGIRRRVGVWGSDDESESSNFKEFQNVVESIEHEVNSGNLDGSLLFFFTDNSTVESALYKGNTSSRKLFELVVRFRKLQMRTGLQFIVSHVAGRRMVAQGTDGVSRGCLREGVAGTGEEMLSYIPLHLHAGERNPQFNQWLTTRIHHSFEVLEPSEWFTRGHEHIGGYKDSAGFWRINTKPGFFIWMPPPSAASVALEELRKSRIKRQSSTHIFVCPRLLTTEWRKQLNKACDLVVFLPPGIDVEGWPTNMFEPRTLGFIFPFLPFHPWHRRNTPKMCYLGREMSRLCKEPGLSPRNFLRKLLDEQLTLSRLPKRVVWKLLHFSS
jgi:hypothetical protein